MSNTSLEYDRVVEKCRDMFMKKTVDYGTAWRILRTSSLTDQIYIKASRIRSIQEKGTNVVDEPIDLEFVGIINYSLMAQIQLKLGPSDHPDLSSEEALEWYDKYAKMTKSLMMDKNDDYGEAWREMRLSSMTDLILMKLLRIKQIEDNQGKTLVSEGLDANYMDIMNYSVFALILMNEE